MKLLRKFWLSILLLVVIPVGWAASGQTIDQWGAAHYQNYGKVEGRTLPANGNYGDYVRAYPDLLAAYNAIRSGSAGATTTEACYGDYVRAYPDLLAAYNASGAGQSIEAWGKVHYQVFGQAESRSACMSGGDYQYLYSHNARYFEGRTVRWKSTTIQISGAVGSWRQAVDRWSNVTNVNLVHVDSTPAIGLGIEIVGYTDLPSNRCGTAGGSYWSSSGESATCKIKMNSNIDNMNCNENWTMTHEVGHCLGFWGHSDDNGIMKGTSASGTGTITDKTRAFINLLYSLSPGTSILSSL